MSHQKNQRWILLSRPKPGPINASDFKMVEQDIPSLKRGEFLVKNTFLSFDPTQRFWMERDTYIPKIELNDVIRSFAAGRVVESSNEAFPVGSRVAGLFGWQEYAVCNGQEPSILPIPKGIPEEAALSVFGLTGLTGYFGMMEVAKVAKGETVLVSGAAGATGSIAAQVAKNCGAKVIGIAGGSKKCQWLLQTAKLDAAIDYKSEDVGALLKDYAPQGVNVFFDNVGGKILDTALLHLALKGRVILCGGISGYDGTADAAIRNYMSLVMNRSSMLGFLIFDYVHQFAEGIKALATMVANKTLAYEVDIQEGLKNAPQTLQRLFEGKNMGKQLLRL